MRQPRSAFSLREAVAVIAVAAIPVIQAGATTVEVIHSIGGGDGEYPATDLVMDDGLIFELMP